MLYIKDLVFFDKHGTGYNFDYNENDNLWTGSIYIDPISEGLFETEKIYVTQKYCVLEEDYDQNMANPVRSYAYGYPATVFPNNSGDYYEFRWDDAVREVDEINMFTFDRSVCPPEDTSALSYNEYDCPELVYASNIQIKNLCENPLNSGIQSGPDANGIYNITYDKNNNWRSGYAEVNICFCDTNDDYSTFRRDLQLYYVNPSGIETLIGIFSIYAKSIEEDERLTVMCHNLGYDINNIDFSIFQDSDIKEQLVDYGLMNNKRKEILMEGHNIYPFIGSYKSLINAIRFFGYDNVTIKEWWKNIDISSTNYGKYFTASSYSLKEHEVIHDGDLITLPSKKFRKTGKLSLAYDINDLERDPDTKNIVDAESSYKGHAYPGTVDNFTYTIEEAVIKLYGLKRKLEKTFLPLTTRIIDMIGENSSFYVSTIRSNMTQNALFDTKTRLNNGFSVLGSEDGCFYLEDLRPFGIRPNPENVLLHRNGVVGEARNGQAKYIGGNYQSLYDENIDDNTQTFGTQVLQNYNTKWSPYNSGNLPQNNIEGYADKWDLNHVAEISVSGDSQEIQAIAGQNTSSTCLGIVPPYHMTGNNLYGVAGPTHDDCIPWIYYNQANISNYGNYYLADFSNYSPNLNKTYRQANDFESDENTCLPDNENIPIGALVELRINENEISWNECTYSWDYIGMMDWIYLSMFLDGLCRVEWHIYKKEDENPDFDITIGGLITHGYSDIGVVLPYVGTYDVTMKIFDWSNNVNIAEKKQAITVYPKEVEFTGWCKMKTNPVTIDSDLTWDTLSTEWDFSYINDVTWNDVKSASFNGLDRGFFAGQYADTDEIDELMMIFNFNDRTENNFALLEDNRGSYFWNNLDVAWQDMDHLWWDATNICGDIPCYFEFGYFDSDGNPIDSDSQYSDSLPGTWLEIVDLNYNYGSFLFPNASSSNLNYMADITRQLNESDDPVLSKFYYSYIWDVNSQDPTHSDLDAPGGFHIVAVSKNHGKTGDMRHVGIVPTSNHAQNNNNILNITINNNYKQLRLYTNSKSYNPSWNDCVYINNITRIPAYTDINFNYTNCRILGKKNPVWKFTNLNTGTVYTSNKKNYHRLFKEKGCWEISLTLNDTNNNVYTTKRNLLIIS